MTPEELDKRISNLEDAFKNHRHTGLDSLKMSLISMRETPADNITQASDAGALYSQAQVQSIVDAVNNVITTLQELNLISDQ
jgi:hypothetical protein